jgi:hypothetical protein
MLVYRLKIEKHLILLINMVYGEEFVLFNFTVPKNNIRIIKTNVLLSQT